MVAELVEKSSWFSAPFDSMVTKTELCQYTVRRIWTGHSQRFSAKDGKPGLFISAKTDSRLHGLDREVALDAGSRRRGEGGVPRVAPFSVEAGRRYGMLVGMVDAIFSDTAQPDQAWTHNASLFFKNGGKMSGPVSVGVTNTPVKSIEETDYVKTGDWHDVHTEDALLEKSVSSVAETVLKHETVHEVAVDRTCSTRSKRAPDRRNLLTS